MRRDTKNKLYIGAAVLGILYVISDKNTKHSLGPRASGQQNAALEHRIQARLEHAASEDDDPGLEKKTKTEGVAAVNVVKKDKQAVAGNEHPAHIPQGEAGLPVPASGPRGPDGFLISPPDDGLHRLTHYGLPEPGARRWIVHNEFYPKPSVLKAWDASPPIDITSYEGPKDPMKTHAFNERVSNTLASDRGVPDTRNPVCKTETYPDVQSLPTVSVIVCFHNEARSTLLRTLRSIIARSPPELLIEVILVDDASDWPIPDDFLAMDKVVGIKLLKREGLIRARTIGAQAARGEVLTFLDSHIECNVDWLLPLVTRISQDYRVVVTPVIDLIDDSTFRYGASPLVRGGFNWALTFKWKSISRTEIRKKQSDPVLSPTMAGGLFAIHRKWFIELGTYDLGMDIWGGENLEMSFRIWQCHGRLEIMPCSRVGHVFRKRHPYNFPGGGIGNIFLKNTLRAGIAWMDDFIQHFYAARGGEPKNFDHGDLSERFALREQLKCNDFAWYLKNVFPEMAIPNKKAMADGELFTGKMGNKLCADSLGHHGGQAVGLFGCHGQGGNQMWTLTKAGELRHDDLCVDAVGKHAEGREVLLKDCGEDGPKVTQTWVHNEADGLIRNPMSGLCLDRAGGQSGGFIKVKGCASKGAAAGDQRWQFGTYHHENDAVKKPSWQKPKWNSEMKRWDKEKDKAKPDIYHQ